MGNTDHTPVHQDHDHKEAQEMQEAQNARKQELDRSKEAENNGNNGNPAQSAGRPNTREQDAHPEPITDDEGNSTTGKDSVEQDDEDVGGDQDRAPDPKIVPVIDKKDADDKDEQGKDK